MLAVVALIAAPAALANDDTITATATVQFSGVVDNLASCTPRHDGDDRLGRWHHGLARTVRRLPSPPARSDQRHAHLRRHRTRSDGHGHDYRGATATAATGATDTFTANVAAPPAQFTECPAVFDNTGCQYLITVNNGTETVLNDPNQGPYEGADDSLIGVLNNSSSPVSELPLAVPGSDLFGFDGDGICDAGGPPDPIRVRPSARHAGRH